MRMTLCLFVLAAAAPATARAEHRGFTGAIAANGGSTHLTSNAVNANMTQPGVGYTLTLGWFVQPQLALGFHANVLFAAFDDTLDGTGANVAFGPVVQYWPTPRASILAGPGYSVAAYKPKDPMTIEQALSTDGGFTPMVGINYYPLGDSGLRISLEAAAMVSGDGIDGYTGSASVGWQFLRAPKR